MLSPKETYTLYNLISISKTIKAFPLIDPEHDKWKEVLKHELMHQAAPKLADGRKYFVQYKKWEGNELDLSLVLEEPMPSYGFSPVEPKCYHAWLLILLLDAKQANVGDYVLFDACMTIRDSPHRVIYSDGIELLFDIVGRFDAGSVWKRIR